MALPCSLRRHLHRDRVEPVVVAVGVALDERLEMGRGRHCEILVPSGRGKNPSRSAWVDVDTRTSIGQSIHMEVRRPFRLRTHHFVLRLNDHERAALDRVAVRLGLSASESMRYLVRRADEQEGSPASAHPTEGKGARSKKVKSR